ncbi:MAG: glycosyltransferase [Cyanobacteria bacterium P01_D01_bin.50]
MFSIVITTQNRLPLLKRSIESALNQTVACEVVIVDDYSSDDTEEYVRSLGSSVVYHRNSTKMGQSKTVNTGVKIASGKWIKLLDDDDYLAPNCIEIFTNAINAHPQAVICSCQAKNVTSNGEILSKTSTIGSGTATYVQQEDIHYGMLIDRLPFGTPVQVAFQKESFLKTGGWHSLFNGYGNDIESWIRIAQYGDAIFVNQCLAYRTIWAGGYSGNFSIKKRLENHILLKQQTLQFVHKKYTNSIPHISEISNFLNLYWGLIELRNRKVDGIKILYPSCLLFKSWQTLAKFFYTKKMQGFKLPICKNLKF